MASNDHLLPDDMSEIDALRRRVAELERALHTKQLSEEHLAQSVATARILYEGVPLPYQSLDENGYFLDVNPAWLEVLGYSREEVVGRYFGDFLAPPFRQLFPQRFAYFKAAGEVQDVQFDVVRKDGTTVSVSFRGKIGHKEDGSFRQTHCLMQDITAQRQAEKAYAETEQRYHQLFHEMSEAFALHEILCDDEGHPQDYRFLDLNPAFEKMTGFSRDDILGKTVREVLPGIEEQWVETYGRVALTGEPIRFESYTATLDRYYDVTANRPAPGRFAVLFRDVTERKRSEEAVRVSEEKYRALTENTTDIILRMDRQFRHLYANPAVESATGIPAPQFIGKTHRELGFPEEMCEFWEAVVQEVFDTGKVRATQFEFEGQSGPIIFDWLVIPEFSPDGQVRSVMTSSRDITALKNAEKAFAESEERLRRAILLSPLPSVIQAEDGAIVLINDAWTDISGYSREEMPTIHHWTRLAYGDRREAMDARIAELFDLNRRRYSGEFEIRTASGEKRIWDFSSSPLGRLPDGRRTVISVASDVTERRRAEMRLSKVSRLYRLLSQINQTIIRAQDHAALFENVCRVAVEDGGFQLAWVGLVNPDNDRVEPAATHGPATPYVGSIFVSASETHSEGRGAVGTAIRSGTHCVIDDLLTNDQMAPWHEVARKWNLRSIASFPLKPGGKVVGALTFYSSEEGFFDEEEVRLLDELAGDVSFALQYIKHEGERRAAEAALADSEKRYRSLFENSMDAILIATVKGNISAANPAATRLFGYSEEELRRVGRAGVVDERDPRMAAAENELATSGRVRAELPMKRKDGSAFEGEVSNVVFHETSGEERTAVFIRDITERKIAEAELRAQREEYHVIFNSSHSHIWYIDLNGRIVRINGVAARSLASTPDKLVGRSVIDLFSRDDAARLFKDNQQVIETGQPLLGIIESSLLPSGETRWYRSDKIPYRDASGEVEGVIIFASDITEARQMEDQLLRAQRLETAGSLAGQVAHDFNNLLGPIAAYPELIKMHLPADSPALVYCDNMLAAAQQMAEINEDMMALARRGLVREQLIDMNQLVQQTLGQMPDKPGTLDVQTRLEPRAFPVGGNPSQLLRVLSNLVINAREAMQEVGTLTLTTENVYLDRPFGRYSRVERGEYVRVSVSDTGCGIPNEIRGKIFDAFFSTKTALRRKGCGLGLSVVHSIVEDHHGYIDLETELRRGTTFHLYLPVRRDLAPAAQTEEKPRGGREKVLVVDDDQGQRSVIAELLTVLGYQVDAVGSGEEAVEYAKRHPVDLMLLDMVMSGIDGAETYRQVSTLCPGQKAVIVSGFSETDRVNDALAMGVLKYVRKPLSLDTLATAVREALA